MRKLKSNLLRSIVQCKDCGYRGSGDCPMRHEEYVDYDEDGYIETDLIVHDYTYDNGFCDRGKRGED